MSRNKSRKALRGPKTPQTVCRKITQQLNEFSGCWPLDRCSKFIRKVDQWILSLSVKLKSSYSNLSLGVNGQTQAKLEILVLTLKALLLDTLMIYLGVN